MRLTQYTVEKDGFCGLFSPIKENKKAAIIVLVDLILPHFYSETKGFVKECRRSRIDLDEHIQSTIKEWITV